MTLIKYRDPESPDYIWFWTVDGHQVSPVFTDEDSAVVWGKEQTDPWDSWKSIKEFV